MTIEAADRARLQDWLRAHLDLPGARLTPASADASFRRYFRVQTPDGGRWILMDAPPEKEDMHPFVRLAGELGRIGLSVPEVQVADHAAGLFLLSDLGDRHYLAELDDDRVERLYGDALSALVTLAACAPRGLPPYDEALLRRELALFHDWLLGRHLDLLDAELEALWEPLQGRLVAGALEQPRVPVHRDYHSRNLMVLERGNPGILDFQDAVLGPLTYDPVSLLRDCYIAWPRARVEDWALGYRQLAEQSGALAGAVVDERTFLRWFDWMGVQRHLKAAGIFARLWHRDGKPGYLADIPRTLGYVVEVCARHPELAAFGGWVERRVLPALGPAAAGAARDAAV